MRCCTEYHPHGSATTDLAAEQGGLGQNPCPADMLAAAAASCMLSMIAYTGTRRGFETEGISISAAVKHDAKGISGLVFDINVPMPQTEQSRRIMETCVANCPVGRAISPEVEKTITWHWTTWMD